ncbi:MAG: hypothetical protein H7Z43_14750, partial [Clostridia bacterium]|nr:hypothetical protein [Deltaproteobacteria bacterium]
AGAIPRVKRMVLQLAKDECDTLLADALSCRRRDEVTELVKQFMSAKMLTTNAYEEYDAS